MRMCVRCRHRLRVTRVLSADRGIELRGHLFRGMQSRMASGSFLDASAFDSIGLE